MTETDRHALVLGASGLIGRHVVLALLQTGVQVTASCRTDDSRRRLAGWLARHGHELPSAPPSGVTEVYNCAGAYRFGMAEDEARRANVDTVREAVEFAAGLPYLRRLVQVSGYRVGGQDPAAWTEEHRRAAYRRLGAYEASRAEADAVFQEHAVRLGVPWSIVNPASVIGESEQYLGLAATLKDLWQGRLPALPGGSRTFVPVVEAGYLARFMTLLPVDEASRDTAYWVLDDDTPALPDLLALVAEEYGVRAPRLRIPVALLRRLPRRLTGADPETLTFLSSDRYPTGPAREFAARHGLTMPDTATTIRRWAVHLAANRFGEQPSPVPHGRRERAARE